MAILLLNYQNEFVKKGGNLYGDIAEVVEEIGVLQNAPQLVQFAREMEALVIYSPVVMKATQNFNEVERSTSFHTNIYSKQDGLFTENTWNCEIAFEVEPRNEDIILHDRSDFSAFAGTKLQSILKDNKINHFFVIGFLTDICVCQTSKDAVKLLPNMSTYVVSDCCAAKSVDIHRDALEEISNKSVTVVSLSNAKSLLGKHAASIKLKNTYGKDQWLMIDKIFAAAGIDDNGEISIDKLQSLIESMPSSTSILSILSDQLEGTSDRVVSKKSMFKILFKRKDRSGFLEKIPLYIIMGVLPLFYSMSTRLPFICLALEIINERQGSYTQVGLVLGAYQTSRALGNLLIVMFGGKDPFKRLEILQILFGSSGWLFLGLYQRNPATSFFSSTGESENNEALLPIWPLFALCGVGLGETIVNLQRAILFETAKEYPSGISDEGVVGDRLSIQYGLVACGSVCAYIGGGLAYNTYGFSAVCELGIICQLVQLIAALTYVGLAKKSKTKLHGDELDGNDVIRCIICQLQAASVMEKYSRSVSSGAEHALTSEVSGFSDAAVKAKNDRILSHSLREMYQSFFNKERDDVSSMEELLNSIDSTRAGVGSLKSRRPLTMAIGKNKLSKLVLFLMKIKGEGSLTEGEFVSFWAPRVYLSMFKSSQGGSVSVVWPYMKAIIFTQSIMALCIGTFLSTALLSYTERFDLNTGTVGILLGIGEASGMMTILSKTFLPSFIAKTKKNNKSPRPSNMKAIISRPLNVPFILFILSISSALFSIDNLALAIVCQMIFSSVNDLSVSLLNELTGTSLPPEKFRYYQGIGQWLRRMGNMVTGLLGPILFEVSKGLPFVFFGLVVFVWSIILWIILHKHAEKIQENKKASKNTSYDNDKSKKGGNCIWSVLEEPFAPFVETSRTPWHVLEQHYYSRNKKRIEEELNPWKKAHVDTFLLEHQIRRIAAALEVEKDQRRALEDRMYARYSDLTEGSKTEEIRRIAAAAPEVEKDQRRTFGSNKFQRTTLIPREPKKIYPFTALQDLFRPTGRLKKWQTREKKIDLRDLTFDFIE
eukprot:CAMPEP_0194172030 /NCGR_PEP_ID=MMETSP0154-20130528/6552_1 /TAXON_ID=1049557 /ORGANISM="Thalassiothrix antarctica, Strain L6-D1" /LENGTH=1053 /DNA_ID=CAMNT_0038884565 /DNA_START=9 /DNA_END=3170 /DNA_ORIENTATION=+